MSSSKRNSKVKSRKSSKKSEVYVNVGPNYQVEVPDIVYKRSPTFLTSHSEREVNVWNPERIPEGDELNTYLTMAKKYRYSEEAARVFLHYHKYNISHAIDDLPNFHPILNTYSKKELRRFLKCVDGRPRKNFVTVKEEFPAYRMSELHALYYSIAAPFKAVKEHNRKRVRGRLLQSCYEKGVKRGFTASSAPVTAPSPNSPSDFQNMDEEEAAIDKDFEKYLTELCGKERASKIVAGVRRGRATNGLSSCPSFFDGLRRHNGRWGIVNGAKQSSKRWKKRNAFEVLDVDLDQLNELLVTPSEELASKEAAMLRSIQDIEAETKDLLEEVERMNAEVFDRLDAFYPEKGFYSVTYRWTETELALLLLALREYGRDFERVAGIIGTKTASLVRDFYNKHNTRFNLDAIISKSYEEEPEEEEEKEDEEEEEAMGETSVAFPQEAEGEEELDYKPSDEFEPEFVTATPVNGEAPAPVSLSSELEPPLIITAPVKRSIKQVPVSEVTEPENTAQTTDAEPSSQVNESIADIEVKPEEEVVEKEAKEEEEEHEETPQKKPPRKPLRGSIKVTTTVAMLRGAQAKESTQSTSLGKRRRSQKSIEADEEGDHPFTTPKRRATVSESTESPEKPLTPRKRGRPPLQKATKAAASSSGALKQKEAKKVPGNVTLSKRTSNRKPTEKTAATTPSGGVRTRRGAPTSSNSGTPVKGRKSTASTSKAMPRASTRRSRRQ